MGDGRYHGLDLLRSAALLIGIVFHAAMPVLAPDYLTQVGVLPRGAHGAPALALLMEWSHAWRMPLFFLLAGFFAQMTLMRKGAAAFLRDRSLRILGVLVIFGAGFAALSGQGALHLGHLWFLWYLYLICVTTAAFWLLAWSGFGRMAAWITASLPRMALLVLPMAGLHGLASHGMGAPNSVLDTAFWPLAYFALFFAMGQCLWVGRARLQDLAKWPVYLPLATMGSLLILAVHRLGIPPLAFHAVAAGAVLAVVYGLIGLCHALFNRLHRAVQFTARIAYPVYVLHVWPTLLLTVAFLNFGLGPNISVMLSALFGMGICIAIYVLAIRYTPLDWLFSGFEKAWFKWPWRTLA